MPSVTIEPGCLRDVSYVTANMRPRDEQEVMCQLPDGIKTYEVAYYLLMGGDCYVAKYRGLPVMAFGTTRMNVAALSMWAIGTKASWRVIPEISRHMIRYLWRKHVDENYQIVEARSHAEHEQAHRWMETTGAVASGEPFVYGKGREKFLLFRWEPSAFPRAAEKYKVDLS